MSNWGLSWAKTTCKINAVYFDSTEQVLGKKKIAAYMIVVTFTSDFFWLKYGLPSTHVYTRSWYPILPRFRRSWRHLMISDGLISPVSLMMSMMTVRHSVGRRFRGWKNFRSEPRDVMPKRTCTRQKHSLFHSVLHLSSIFRANKI